jgi:hypothetical protein
VTRRGHKNGFEGAEIEGREVAFCWGLWVVFLPAGVDDGAGHLHKDDALANDGAEGEGEGPASMVMVVVVEVVMVMVMMMATLMKPLIVINKQQPQRVCTHQLFI